MNKNIVSNLFIENIIKNCLNNIIKNIIDCNILNEFSYGKDSNININYYKNKPNLYKLSLKEKSIIQLLETNSIKEESDTYYDEYNEGKENELVDEHKPNNNISNNDEPNNNISNNDEPDINIPNDDELDNEMKILCKNDNQIYEEPNEFCDNDNDIRKDLEINKSINILDNKEKNIDNYNKEEISTEINIDESIENDILNEIENNTIYLGYESDSTILSMDSSMSKIVISILCTPFTLNLIEKTVDSLYSVNYECIYLVIYESMKNNISENLKDKCKIIITPCYNPINSIYTIIKRENDPTTIIVCIKNGYIYPNNLDKEIKKCFKRFPSSAHCLSLMKFKSINYFEYINVNGNIGDIYESCYLIAFKRYFFKNDFTSYLNILLKYDYCKHYEELLIANYLAKYKIQIRCINKKKFNKFLIGKLAIYEKIHTTSGLNNRIITNYYKIIQLLGKLTMLYLKNSIRIQDYFRYLSNNPYNIPLY